MSNDTYVTPRVYTNALAPFDLDPCEAIEQPWKHALRGYTENGLTREWFGRIWLNPPYSNPRPWLQKLACHGSGIALVNVCPDTKWWRENINGKASMVYLVHKRINFYRRGVDGWGIAENPAKPSALIAYGWRNVEAIVSLRRVDNPMLQGTPMVELK